MINLILSFVTRTVFIMVLSQSYLGINGLFTNILSVLSLAELGVGAALIFHMYKPIANEDTKAITEMMNLYRILYRIIAFVVAVLGLILVPFLDIFIKDAGDVKNITFIYLLYLLNTVCTYLWGYKRSLIEGHQKAYICTIISVCFTSCQFILQTGVLLKFKNFIAYLIIQIACSILINIVLAIVADHMYPYLKSDKKSIPDKDTRKSIFKNAGAMSIHKLGDVVLNNTDSLIMSSFIGVGAVGIYSNYLLISTSVNTALSSMLSATTASIGNLNASENKESVFRVFKVMLFFTFVIYGFACVAFMVLFNPFIEAWTAATGKNYVFPLYIVFIFTLNFYINGMRKASLTFRDAMGLYWYDRYKPIAEVVINLVFSIILAMKFGIIGIMLGTLISIVSTCLWIEPLVLYKYGFEVSLSHYFKTFLKYTLSMFVYGGLTYILCDHLFTMGGFIEVLLKLLVCTILYNGLIAITFCRSEEFKSLYQEVVKILKKNKE